MDACTLLLFLVLCLIQLSLTNFTWNQADACRKSKKAKETDDRGLYNQKIVKV